MIPLTLGLIILGIVMIGIYFRERKTRMNSWIWLGAGIILILITAIFWINLLLNAT